MILPSQDRKKHFLRQPNLTICSIFTLVPNSQIIVCLQLGTCPRWTCLGSTRCSLELEVASSRASAAIHTRAHWAGSHLTTAELGWPPCITDGSARARVPVVGPEVQQAENHRFSKQCFTAQWMQMLAALGLGLWTRRWPHQDTAELYSQRFPVEQTAPVVPPCMHGQWSAGSAGSSWRSRAWQASLPPLLCWQR